MDPDLYRRRQRRRAMIGWATLIVVALVVIGVAVASGGGTHRTTDLGTTDPGVLGISAEMTSTEYESIHEGEEETAIVGRLGSGLTEGQVPQNLLTLFPAQPNDSRCAFWTLSDAPEHLVRLCFDKEHGLLVQKSVAAQGEEAAPKTLA